MMANFFKSLIAKIKEKESITFSLVWRDDLDFSYNAQLFKEKLAPFLRDEKRVSEWPGTELDGEGATMRFYTLNNDSYNILLCVQSPFEFLAPDFPEDLALYDNGEILYSSCAHEKIEWFG